MPGRLYADFAILRGDPSDGLPGLVGVGDKKAAELVNRYGGLDVPALQPGLDHQDLSSQCLKLGEEVGELYRAVRKLQGNPQDPSGRITG